MLRIIFAVSRYDCFMERNVIKTIAVVNLQKKRNVESHQTLTGYYKNSEEVLNELQNTQNIKR